MDRFEKYNPKVILLFFLIIIIETLLIFNPIYLSVNFLFAFIYKIYKDGKSAFIYLVKLIFPIIILTTVFNMIFAHYGMTVLFSINNTNFTLESAFYGFTQGLTVSTVILWLNAYNNIVSSEMLLSVFGKVMPNTAMIFSMSLTFIPRLKKNASEINDARKLLDKDKGKLKSAINSLMALIMLTFEESIEVNDSMKARGFNGKRTVYSKYKLSVNDVIFAFVEVIIFTFVVLYKLLGKTAFIIDPKITIPIFSITAFIIYSLLPMLPVIINILQEIRWKRLRQKI